MPQLEPRADDAQGARPRPGAFSALLRELVRSPLDESSVSWDAVLFPGAVVGRFELVQEVGRGGFGVVWEARDRVLGRTVAFKALRAGGSPDIREERLLREAEAAARLAHPNIVTLHDVGRSEHGPYLVLELLRGETLAQRLDRGLVPLPEAIHLALEVAKGLAHAHAQGVVHRDLTPGNVFLCEDGQVKVLDLGMAHAFGRPKLEGGTPAYMAPEQWRGAPEDERTDVFALGVLLFRMLEGRAPFPGDDGRWVSEGVAAPALVTPELPGLGALVGRMLARDPLGRPRDAREVVAELAALDDALPRRTPRAAATPVTPAPALPALPAPAPGARSARSRQLAIALAAVLLVLALGAAGALLFRQRPGAVSRGGSPAIAVLPFADLSPQRDQEYFSDGLAEEIRSALSRVEGLHVAGRTSSDAFKGRGVDLRSVGEQLHVGAVLEGSVRKAGARVRVTAQLVSADDGMRMWSASFDRELSDIFAVQDEIARAVVGALQVKLGPAHAQRRPATVQAYQQYLIAREAYARYSQEGLVMAREAYERAVALDAGYAPAWAGLSIALGYAADAADDRRRSAELRALALEAAERAVALDPELPEAYSARGYLRGAVRRDWEGAATDLERALALSPSDATTQRRFGILRGIEGRADEAVAATRRAIELDPLVAANWTALGNHYLGQGQLGLARVAWHRALEIAPEYEGVSWSLALLDLLEGHPAEALAAFEREPDEANRLEGVALAQHALGRDAEARAALTVLAERYGERRPHMVAGVYAFLGDRDRAFTWIRRAISRGDAGILGLRLDPLFAPLRGDARFAAALRDLNLPAS